MKDTLKIKVIISSVIVIALIFIGCLIAFSNKKLVCTSSKGDITLYYNREKITKYEVKNMDYNLKEQNIYAKEVGMDKYLEEFSQWFKDNTDGKCQKK